MHSRRSRSVKDFDVANVAMTGPGNGRLFSECSHSYVGRIEMPSEPLTYLLLLVNLDVSNSLFKLLRDMMVNWT